MLPTNLSPVDRATLSLSFSDYLRFRQLLEDRFGLTFPEKRRMELEIGVRRAFAASTCPDLHKYYETLRDPVHGLMELERLVNHVTVGETHFFRDAGQMNALQQHVLPQIIERRRAARTLRIWSAGCASGEEPYSIAMLLRDLIPDLDHWTVTILATDINTQHLERAYRGLYSEWAFREIQAKQMRPRFFTQKGNQYELHPDIRRLVTFRQLNLAEDVYPSYETNSMFMDLILCRNVTIYFPEAVTRTVVDRFYQSIVEGGWLVIGHSEHSLNTYQSFHARTFPEAILYQRMAEPPPQPFAQPLTTPAQPLARRGDLRPRTVLPAPAQPPPAPVPPPSSSQPQPANLLEQAQALLAYGSTDRACELLLRWLTDHPNHVEGCTLLGKAYADMGNWHEAERWCQLAISIDRLNLDAYYTLALVHQHQGRQDQAVEYMKKVVYIDRGDILGHFNLATMFYNRGQVPLALKFLQNTRRLLEARPIEHLVPRSGDLTVGRLAQTVMELQQLWEKATVTGTNHETLAGETQVKE